MCSFDDRSQADTGTVPDEGNEKTWRDYLYGPRAVKNNLSTPSREINEGSIRPHPLEKLSELGGIIAKLIWLIA